MMNRRELMKGLMAGGIMTASGWWFPGEKVISIPSGKIFTGSDIEFNGVFKMLDQNTIAYCGPPHDTVSVYDFYNWLKENAAHMLKRTPEDLSVKYSMIPEDPHSVTLEAGYRISNAEHLTEGTLKQDTTGINGRLGMSEVWQSWTDLEGDGEFFDKIYVEADCHPRERLTELDTGHVGYR